MDIEADGRKYHEKSNQYGLVVDTFETKLEEEADKTRKKQKLIHVFRFTLTSFIQSCPICYSMHILFNAKCQNTHFLADGMLAEEWQKLCSVNSNLKATWEPSLREFMENSKHPMEHAPLDEQKDSLTWFLYQALTDPSVTYDNTSPETIGESVAQVAFEKFRAANLATSDFPKPAVFANVSTGRSRPPLLRARSAPQVSRQSFILPLRPPSNKCAKVRTSSLCLFSLPLSPPRPPLLAGGTAGAESPFRCSSRLSFLLFDVCCPLISIFPLPNSISCHQMPFPVAWPTTLYPYYYFNYFHHHYCYFHYYYYFHYFHHLPLPAAAALLLLLLLPPQSSRH
jgi:hypothetical protein